MFSEGKDCVGISADGHGVNYASRRNEVKHLHLLTCQHWVICSLQALTAVMCFSSGRKVLLIWPSCDCWHHTGTKEHLTSLIDQCECSISATKTSWHLITSIYYDVCKLTLWIKLQNFHPELLQPLTESISSGYNGALLICGASTDNSCTLIDHSIIKQVETTTKLHLIFADFIFSHF